MHGPCLASIIMHKRNKTSKITLRTATRQNNNEPANGQVIFHAAKNLGIERKRVDEFLQTRLIETGDKRGQTNKDGNKRINKDEDCQIVKIRQ